MDTSRALRITTALRSTTALALAVLAVLVACPSCERAASVPRVHTFVGYVENSDAFVALVRVDDSVVAYVCDGRSTAAWLRGDAAGDTFDVRSDEARLRAVFGRSGITGTFTSAQGGAYPFTARPAAEGAGFYRASQTAAGLSYVGGWIILRDGQQRGAVKQDGAILAGTSPRLDPRALTVTLPGGVTLTAKPAALMLTEPAAVSPQAAAP